MAASVVASPTVPLPSSAHPLATQSNGQHYTQAPTSPVARDPLSPTAQDANGHAGHLNGASSKGVDPNSHSTLPEAQGSALHKQNRKSGWIELNTGARNQDRPNVSSSSRDQAKRETEAWSSEGDRRRRSVIGYPYSPNGDEPDGEAKAIEENLERWAAAEKQRRRAMRASRSTSLVGPAGDSPTSSLAKRLSILGRKASTTVGSGSNKGADGSLAAPDSPMAGAAALLRRGSKSESMSSAEDGRESGDSSQRSLRAVNSNISAHSGKRQLDHSIVEESEGDSLRGSSTASSATTEAKGKWKASDSDVGWSVPASAAEQRRLASDNYDSAAAAAAAATSPNTASGNPFGDESEAVAEQRSPDVLKTSTRRRSSVADQPLGRTFSQSGKATPRRPIVTPGRAPSIRYHADKSGTRAPAIVATDVDRAGREAAGNPFLGKEEGEDASRNRYSMRSSSAYNSAGSRPARQASASGLMEDLVEEPSTPTSESPAGSRLDESPEKRMSQLAPARTSTSTSRFNEVGLDEDDAWSPNMQQESSGPGRGLQPARDAAESDGRRRPWWTELLCGCGLAPGADDEQTGKTGPE